MKNKYTVFAKITILLGFAAALAFASGCSTTSSGGDGMKPMKGGEHLDMLHR